MTYTATLRGLTIGDDTLYPWAAAPAGLGVTARQARVPVARGGAMPTAPDVPEAGDLTIEVHLIGDTEPEVLSLRDALAAAWVAKRTEGLEELSLGFDADVRVYRGRPLSMTPSLDLMRAGKAGAAQLVFAVFDPLWYSGDVKQATAIVAAMTGGMTTPMVTPMVMTGSGSSGDVSVTNDGTADAPWTATVLGPITTPRLMLNGQMIQIDGTVDAGSVLFIDSRSRAVLLDGQPRPWSPPLSSWWEIPPGQSTFSFRAVAGTGSATLTWRDANY